MSTSHAVSAKWVKCLSSFDTRYNINQTRHISVWTLGDIGTPYLPLEHRVQINHTRHVQCLSSGWRVFRSNTECTINYIRHISVCRKHTRHINVCRKHTRHISVCRNHTRHIIVCRNHTHHISVRRNHTRYISVCRNYTRHISVYKKTRVTLVCVVWAIRLPLQQRAQNKR